MAKFIMTHWKVAELKEMRKVRLTKAQKIAIAKRAKVIIRKGWTKGSWHRTAKDLNKKNDSYCLEGACNLAAIEVLGPELACEVGAARAGLSYTHGAYTKDYSKARVADDSHFTKRLSVTKAAREYGERKFGKVFRSANGFNDSKEVKKADVLAVLDAYIASKES